MLSALPQDVLVHVLRLVDDKSMFNVICSTRQMYKLAQQFDESIFKQRCFAQPTSSWRCTFFEHLFHARKYDNLIPEHIANAQDLEMQIKVILDGPENAGKSALVQSLFYNQPCKSNSGSQQQMGADNVTTKNIHLLISN